VNLSAGLKDILNKDICQSLKGSYIEERNLPQAKNLFLFRLILHSQLYFCPCYTIAAIYCSMISPSISLLFPADEGSLLQANCKILVREQNLTGLWRFFFRLGYNAVLCGRSCGTYAYCHLLQGTGNNTWEERTFLPNL